SGHGFGCGLVRPRLRPRRGALWQASESERSYQKEGRMQWLIWLGVLVMAAPAWGTTYYVAAGSSNSNNCTLAQDITTPISTVQNGANCLTTGSTDTLYIRAGVYNLGAWSGPPSGTSSHPLTIAGYPNDGSLAVQLNVGASGANGITLTSQ